MFARLCGIIGGSVTAAHNILEDLNAVLVTLSNDFYD